MTYGATGRLLLTPVDKEGPERARRLLRLDLGRRPEAAFDLFADRLAEVTGAPCAMVNFIDEKRQFFAGLHTPDGGRDGVRPSAARRSRARDHGFCPHVVARRRALVLDDVRDYPRFAANRVVDEAGIRSYLGAPLLDDRTGLALGTVCVVDTEPRLWGRSGLATIKEMAGELMDVVRERDEPAA